jgi:hypothetical protein
MANNRRIPRATEIYWEVYHKNILTFRYTEYAMLKITKLQEWYSLSPKTEAEIYIYIRVEQKSTSFIWIFIKF